MLTAFNYRGLAMLLAGGLVAFGGGRLLRTSAEPPLMVILGLVVGALDVGYRLHRGRAAVSRNASLWERAQTMGLDWVRPNTGGSLFFLPTWGFGVLWVVLGAVRIVRGS
jgi:hypothetical protein